MKCVWLITLANRASNVPVTVRSAEGVKTVKIDQKKKAPVDGLFILWAATGLNPDKTRWWRPTKARTAT